MHFNPDSNVNITPTNRRLTELIYELRFVSRKDERKDARDNDVDVIDAVSAQFVRSVAGGTSNENCSSCGCAEKVAA